MVMRTLGYVTGAGTLTVAAAYEKAEAIAAILRPLYQGGKLLGYRSCAVVDDESYDEVLLDPDVVAHKVQGKLPFVCVSITFDDAALPANAAEPTGWSEVVKAHALEAL